MKEKPCNFNGANWLEIKRDSQGVHLRSTAKNVEDIVVSHKHAKNIHDGWKR